MTQRVASFTEADIRRAINGARKAGFRIGAIEVTRDGTIRLVPPREDHKPLDEAEEIDLG